ncbi:MAG TPA: hypothetical protein VLF40_00330 [Candidatus Saccharimonadales bacterium]|nr:hypothetical protein [Candidatus Saccharimonadales bacterium]
MTTEAHAPNNDFYGEEEPRPGTPLAKPGAFDSDAADGAAEVAAIPPETPPAGGEPEHGHNRPTANGLKLAGLAIKNAAHFGDHSDPTTVNAHMADNADLHNPLSNRPARNGVDVTTNNRPSRYGRFSI